MNFCSTNRPQSLGFSHYVGKNVVTENAIRMKDIGDGKMLVNNCLNTNIFSYLETSGIWWSKL
jgi:hypothetical protein